MNRPVPDAVRKIIDAMVSRAVARCHEEGIPLADFYRTLLEEKASRPTGTITDLFDRTFRRLKTT